MKTLRLRSAATAIAAMIIGLAPQIANACAMCGLSPGDSAGHAYNTSVLFMLIGPYVTFGAIGGIVVLAVRRGRKNADAADR
ncbi:MAG TPA: hypothetical protein VEU51_07330 [Candidatus Acidoferrales bacterium]|nr:hypothetical protein [Candidatus Acidoferrales bacterium]